MEGNIPTGDMPVNAGLEVPVTNAPDSEVPSALAERYKIMVDNQEIEVDLDELKRGYGHNKAAAQRMTEAQNMRKEVEHALRQLKADPLAVLGMMGHDVDAIMTQRLNAQLEEAMLSDEQRDLRRYKQELEQYQTAEQQAREEYERSIMEQQAAEMREHLSNQVVDALQASNLPRNSRTVERIGYYMKGAHAAGFTNVTPHDVVPYVRQDYLADIQSLMSDITPEQYETMLGKDNVAKIAKAMAKQQTYVEKKVAKPVAPVKGPKKQIPMTPRDFFFGKK